MSVARNEYPRPQFRREEWLCLNGEWEFEIDPADTGIERDLKERPLPMRIMPPFCPESNLSGIGNSDFLNAVWYRREVAIPESWRDRKVLLHFQAVDYDATVWINGREAGHHRGRSWGYGRRPADIEELYARFEGLCRVLIEDPNMFGYCYTQLTDVFQEQNGIYFFDRSEKFDMNRIRQVQQRPAAIEQHT